MKDTTPLPAFVHDPLHDSTTHFRLLHITRGNFEQHVECEISSWPIENSPPYYAMSYTWGDPADTAEISLHGRPFMVRQNCQYVLQQAFTTKASKYYWVDALCINQMSTQERNHQVGIMGKIYSRAQQVFACVGPHANDSEYLGAILSHKSSLLDEIYSSIDSFYSNSPALPRGNMFPPKFRCNDNPNFRITWLGLRCMLMMSASRRQKLCDAFLSFIRRPYFSRVWILQELYLATEVSYCWGATVQSSKKLIALEYLFRFWLIEWDIPIHNKPLKLLWEVLIRMPVQHRGKACWLMWSDFDKVRDRRERLTIASGTQKLKELQLILTMIKRFECTDLRDKLYGVISAVDWGTIPAPNPDYSKDNFQVAFDAFNHIATRGIRSSSYAVRSTAHDILQIFGVTLTAATLRNAIERRSDRFEEPMLPISSKLGISVEVEEEHWLGIKIGDIHHQRDGSKEDGTRMRRMWPEQDKGFTMRGSGFATVFAPLDTRPDDWYITNRDVDPRTFGNHVAGLIVRKSDNEQYTLIGPTLTSRDEPQIHRRERNVYADFRVFWHAEHLLVSIWMLDQLPRTATPDEQICHLVNMRICASKDSSYCIKDDEGHTKEML
jgi:hypothetical protein